MVLGILCLAFPSPTLAARWVDATGRTLDVAARPRRIVSLVPSLTELLFALGLGERVVGVTNFCNYPAEANRKPRVGGYADPSLEAIVALRPDLVLASADSTKRQLVARLEAAGVPVYVVYPRTYDQTAEMIRAVGRAAGAPEAGARLAHELEAAARRVRASVARRGGARPRVLVAIMLRPLIVAGPGTFIDDLVFLAGGVNAVPAGPAHYPTWSPEALLAVDPDVIVAAAHPSDPPPARFLAPWPELSAVARGHVAAIDPDWLQRPGPRLALGLEALARAIAGTAAGRTR